MNSIQRKRAYRFANFLMKVPTGQFDIDVICKTNGEVDEVTPGKCGTVACAFGHLPLFNKRRFAYCGFNKYVLYRSEYVLVFDKITMSNDMYKILFDYFGFTYDKIEFIFHQHGYKKQSKITPKDVSKRIIGLLKKDKRTLNLFKKFIGN